MRGHRITNGRVRGVVGAFDDERDLVIVVILFQQCFQIGFQIDIDALARRKQNHVAGCLAMDRAAYATSHVATMFPRLQRQKQRLDNHQSRQNQIKREPIRMHARTEIFNGNGIE